MTTTGIPPLVDVDQPLMDGWRIRLPFPMARRIEDGSLVFWHSPRRLTLWIDAYDVSTEEDPVFHWEAAMSPEARDVVLERNGSVVRHAYRTIEEDGSETLLGHVSDRRTEILIAARYDDPPSIDYALAAWPSIASTDDRHVRIR